MTRRILRQPEYGEMPPRLAAGWAHAPRKPFRYLALLDMVRAHPHVPAKVCSFTGPTEAKTARLCRTEQRAIQLWLDKNFPDEHWEIHTRRVPDTWAARDVWVIYHGVDQAMARKLRADRRAFYENIQRKGAERKAARLAQERMRLIRDNEENHADRALRKSLSGRSEAGLG